LIAQLYRQIGHFNPEGSSSVK